MLLMSVLICGTARAGGYEGGYADVDRVYDIMLIAGGARQVREPVVIGREGNMIVFTLPLQGKVHESGIKVAVETGHDNQSYARVVLPEVDGYGKACLKFFPQLMQLQYSSLGEWYEEAESLPITLDVNSVMPELKDGNLVLKFKNFTSKKRPIMILGQKTEEVSIQKSSACGTCAKEVVGNSAPVVK